MPIWISNLIPSKVWDGITLPFPNVISCTIVVWEWISNFIPLYIEFNYSSMLGLELNHVSERGLWYKLIQYIILDTYIDYHLTWVRGEHWTNKLQISWSTGYQDMLDYPILMTTLLCELFPFIEIAPQILCFFAIKNRYTNLVQRYYW